jgi:hypothetical protein
MKLILTKIGVAALLMAGAGVGGAPAASADGGDYGFGPNCDTVPIGFFKAKLRTVCDTPIRPDGSWSRRRVFWIPAHHVSAQSDCSSSTYSSHCTFTDAYDVDDTIVDGPDNYVVFPDNVLPDEPGHLPV